jgi:iron complex outermembrane recepter protein
VVFNKKKILLISFQIISFFGWTQTTITGRVYDFQTLRELPGANVQVIGASQGTSTNESGLYIFSLPENKDYYLKFSYLGFRDTSVFIARSDFKKNTVNIWLKPESYETGTVFITATRTVLNPENIPSRIEIISKKEIEDNPVLNADDILQTIPGMNIDRDWGVFSKNASVTMRGLSGTPRTLVLLDGIPLNKTDGGGINWNMINPDIIERIEVIKGPVSTIYGGNAMSGVINVITQRPSKEMEGDFKAFYGTYNTYGTTLNLGGQKFKNNKGLYYGIYGYYKNGDGYITAPDSTKNSFDIKTFVQEYSGSFKGGYQFNPASYIEAEYNFYDDKRGEGTKIYEEGGTYDKYTTNSLRATLNYKLDQAKIVINSFYLDEHYFRQNESMSVKKSNKYTLYNTDAERIDKGVWCSVNSNLTRNQSITTGLDAKQGSVDGSDIYFTSSDVLINKGKMNFLALFAEYDISLFKNKVRFTAGLRYDIAEFKDGSFVIEDPSTLTAFMVNYPTDFTNNKWKAFSPKLAGKYFFTDNLNLYVSYAKGFRAPMLDDMCKNGNITKGFKIANPQLNPETLDNYEIGFNINLFNKLLIQPSFYNSIGNDFQYFVNKGDSVYTGGDNLKPVLRRENISKARVTGSEISVNYRMSKSLLLIANYAYNHSKIIKFNSENNPLQDLTGKYITGVAPNQFFAGLYWKNKYFNAAGSFSYIDKQWSDDANTIIIPGYNSIDLKIIKIVKSYTAALTVHDIMNNRHLNEKGELSPGRFFMLSISYKL